MTTTQLILYRCRKRWRWLLWYVWDTIDGAQYRDWRPIERGEER